MTTATRWRKSRLSDAQDTCVELAHTGDAVRDSKNPAGPTLTVDTLPLLTAVKNGHLDQPTS
ncbi:DUF397 domain-containing protein [Actinophytocola sp.]|uniref:DUF397 domain-containing protein n=1 Tax=Actinophytocola sp. TaxID=1872138 RepID=UPI002D2BFCEE|nr:DUF397 domain-containing protein [Actinophytocola sp.]HYQ69946.1 DUF397 domain-containing protein [Actinophytocola sp.]